MDGDRLQFVVRSALEENAVPYRETALLFCTAAILDLRHWNVRLPEERRVPEIADAVCRALAKRSDAFSKAVLPHLPERLSRGEDRAVWEQAAVLSVRLAKYTDALQDRAGLAAAFQTLLYQLAERSAQLGAAVAPPDVTAVTALLIQKLFGKRKAVSVCDPVCGAGGFLACAAQTLARSDLRLAGYETDSDMADVCAAWLTLADCRDWAVLPGRAEWEQLHGAAPRKEDRFDLVIARVPFGNRREAEFLQRMLEAAAPNGAAVAVIPNGVLFRTGRDGDCRRRWIAENRLDTVLYLPENLLYGTRIPVSVVVLRPDREEGEPVRMIDLRHGEEIGRRRSRLGDDLLRAAELALDGPEGGRVHLAGRAELEWNDCFLNRERYFPERGPEAETPPPSLESIRALEAELAQTEARLEDYYLRFDDAYQRD